MRDIIRRSTTIWGAAIAVAIILCVSLFFVMHAKADALTGSGRLLTIHDRGTDKVLLSEAATVGDALKEAGFTLDSHDVVEPKLNEKLVASEYQINIYRARPVTVIDGPMREKIVTAYQTADQIVKDAGIHLYSEDKTTLQRSNDIVNDGAGLELTITRAVPFNFTLYGTTSTARTQGKTVGDMLKEKGITLGKNDRASVPLSTPITNGMDVRVWREGKQTITVQEDVPFDTQTIQDADQPVGYTAVQTPGVNGKQNATYEVEIRDGKEVGRTKIANLVTIQSVTQVEIIGSKSRIMPYTGGGTKTQWLSRSNIPQEYWGVADAIVSQESGWNPNAVNRSSGACGLAQALPCSKVPGNPYNPVDSLNWMNGYVTSRYGGWAGAYDHKQITGWY